MRSFSFLLALILSSGGAASAAEPPIRGAGASFPGAVYTTWAAAYEKTTGRPVVYQSTGSGDGQKRIMARELDFGASDSVLSADELARHELIQIPMVIGGVVPVVNLPGIKPNQLQLSGELLADIMRAEVTMWDDRRIASLNPGLRLPALPIARIVRADKSGSTEAFTRYLSAVSPAWKGAVGQGLAVPWPGRPTAADGNDGVVKGLLAVHGSIAYVSFDRVTRQGLSAVRLRNRAGNFVAASEEGFRAAVQQSGLARTGDERVSLLDQAGPFSWPITLTTYVLLDTKPRSAERARSTAKFLYWILLRGDELIRASGFTALPVIVQARLVRRFDQIKPQDGPLLDFQVGL